MLKKSSAIDRLLRENKSLEERRFGLPDIGKRVDGDFFNPTVQKIADAIDFYGYEIRDELITTQKDIDLGGGNPIEFKPFGPALERMKESLEHELMYRYPYTEGDDRIRKCLLDYVESIGFINTAPYAYQDIDKKGLSVHNITFLPSTSVAFNMIINIIAKPGDVLLVPGPNYGLFTIRAERAGAEVELLPLRREDHYLINPELLAQKIDEINESLQLVYRRRKGYVPRVVGLLNANPNNPTGKIMSEKDAKLLKQISDVCQERGVFVIDDLVYRDISFKEEEVAKPIASIPGAFRNTISLFGLSKSYGMASLRAGFVVADEIIIRELINRIFQTMDSAPDLIGQALAGAFNASKEREEAYQAYFKELRDVYRHQYNLLIALVDGIKKVPKEDRALVKEEITAVLKEDTEEALKGLPYVTFPKNLTPDAGFFAILDFTKVKGMKYKGSTIQTERDLLQFFYKTCRIRFLIGQSISWPYEEELVGRVTFAMNPKEMIMAFSKMGKVLSKLTTGEDYIIRKNRMEDQGQMAEIKISGWQTAYDKIVSSKYLEKLDVKELTKRYLASFEEYKDLVLVAVRGKEVLGYSCFLKKDNQKYDVELISLYVKKDYLNQGIGTNLFVHTAKLLLEEKRTNMIVWCFKKEKNSCKFYQDLGGKIVEEKEEAVGEEIYPKVGFYFDLKEVVEKFH